MSASTEDMSASNDGNQVNESSRPQTVSLTKLRKDNNNSEDETSIGDVFFSKVNVSPGENNDNTTHNVHNADNSVDSNPKSNDNSPKLRPKTVIKQRTDGYQQRLVNIGATQNQTVSPKPKSENCYICGKEFLLTSLKIHEKQCAKKQEKALKTNAVPNKSKISKKPQLEACYLCGKDFFVHSLGIHETQCIKNWKANKTPDANDQTVSERTIMKDQGKPHNVLPKDVRSDKVEKSAMENSSLEDGTEDNVSPQKALKSDSEKAKNNPASPKPMQSKPSPCYLCGVAFLPHSLKLHEKKCREKSEDNGSFQEDTVEKDTLSEEVFDRLTIETVVQQNIGTNSSSDEANNPSQTCISKKPMTVICYICGKEFLKSSYPFHEKKCSSNNKESQTTKVDTPEKKQVTNRPNSMKPKTVVCYICGEDVLKSSYQFHQKKCTNKVENLKEKEVTPDQVTTKAIPNRVRNYQKPRTITCGICGQEFLKSSFAFHEKQCSKNKMGDPVPENEKLKLKESIANKEHQGPSEEERPETPRRRKPKSKACYICGKEILISSSKVHEEQCQKKTDILKNINQQKSPQISNKKVGRQSGEAKFKAESKPKTELCYICGESFLTSSIKVHEAQCKKRWNEYA
ncbi:zinc finger protein 474-like [Dendronephthya gigantea]|uniref:zinc finger protein 474-like n=1 Tax=Dendronephthya gigantea TaxID=151771 RepID=UPI00106CF71C|nr:zinc finger protein 474-like [Dendronephthya gigantea]